MKPAMAVVGRRRSGIVESDGGPRLALLVNDAVRCWLRVAHSIN